MNEAPNDAWFYTREGDRIGPVTFAELKTRAREAGLNPRLDMVWTHGMPEWKPAGEIENLFERRTAPEPEESLAPSADPYAPPQHESAADMMGKEGEWPGARRRSFLFACLIFPILWGAGMAFATPFLSTQFGPELMKVITPASNIVPFIIGLYFGLGRLVNLGMSRWWYLANFIPILNFWVGYRCFACPAGYAYHKKLDGIGIFLAIIYWLTLVVALLAVVAVIAVIFGALGTETQQQFQEILRQAMQPKA